MRDTTGILTERDPLKLYLLAVLVGFIASFASIGYIYAYELLRKWIYLSPTVNLAIISSKTPAWYFFLLFIGGGGLIGLFIYYLIPYHGHDNGMPHLLYRFKHMQPISVQEGTSTTVASILSLGIGASVGRESPIMFLGGSLASWFCKIFHINGHYYRVLLCAAIASSLSTSLHLSLVGIFFVLEIVSFSITTLDLLPIALAIFAGVAIRLIFPGILTPIFYRLQVEGNTNHILTYVVLGLIAGFLALLFTKSLTFTIKSHFNSRLPNWIWPAIGGIALSFMMIYIPDAMGIGFDRVPLNSNLSLIPLKFILVLLVAKLVSTYISLGFGFSGGIISPVFVAGMLLGVLYASCLQFIFPNALISFHVYALAATAAFTSAIIGAPLTLTMLAFEVSRSIDVTFNTFLAVFCATLVMKCFKVKSFFQSLYLFLYAD